MANFQGGAVGFRNLCGTPRTHTNRQVGNGPAYDYSDMVGPKNRLFAFGSNGSAQLGLGHNDDTTRPEPSGVSLSSIREVAAGGNYSLVLGNDGTVESHGKDGHDDRFGTYGLRRISQVSATWTASILLSDEGTVLTCGEGPSGELGLGVETLQAARLREVPDFPPIGAKVVQIASGVSHTVTVLSNGELWGWGKGRQGQLGEPAGIIWSPRQVRDLPFRVVKAVCGKDFTCVFGDRDNGYVHLIGLNQRDRFNLVAGMPLAISGWKNGAASWSNVYVLKDDGELLGFGRNDHGQLPPPGLPPIEAVAAGSEHCIALTKSGKVLAWGWGEHGNCGEPTDANGDVKGRWNEIGVAGTIKGVFAGCATSFVVTAALAMHDGEPR
ncbi:alpha tubulin suppressor [Friedmanniomyces endolithicus]|nr:alpha tubulin suppressor [Friedmanniomyces endolithicus]